MSVPPTHGNRIRLKIPILPSSQYWYFSECEKKSVKNNPSMIEYK